MTIKSEDKKIKRVWCKKVKQYLEDNWGGIGLVVVGILTFVIVLNLILNFTNKPTASNMTEEELAKVLVRANYPDVLCMATHSGAFRTYKTGTYKIGIREDVGWNIWVEPHESANAFHLAKCEVK